MSCKSRIPFKRRRIRVRIGKDRFPYRLLRHGFAFLSIMSAVLPALFVIDLAVPSRVLHQPLWLAIGGLVVVPILLLTTCLFVVIADFRWYRVVYRRWRSIKAIRDQRTPLPGVA